MAVETTNVDHHDDVGVGVGQCGRRGVPGPRRADLHVTVTTPNDADDDDDETITLDQFLAECDRSPRSRVRTAEWLARPGSARQNERPFRSNGTRVFFLLGFRSDGFSFYWTEASASSRVELLGMGKRATS